MLVSPPKCYNVRSPPPLGAETETGGETGSETGSKTGGETGGETGSETGVRQGARQGVRQGRDRERDRVETEGEMGQNEIILGFRVPTKMLQCKVPTTMRGMG